MYKINFKVMKLINIIKKIISKFLSNPYIQIIIEYLSICILPSFICTALLLIPLMIFIHFTIPLKVYPSFTVGLYFFLTLVSIGSLWPKYVSKIIKFWEKHSFNHIKSENPSKNLRLCNYALYTIVSFIYSLWYLQCGKCSAYVEAFYYALVTYLGLDNCLNFIKSIRINKH